MQDFEKLGAFYLGKELKMAKPVKNWSCTIPKISPRMLS